MGFSILLSVTLKLGINRAMRFILEWHALLMGDVEIHPKSNNKQKNDLRV
jgi:hypothetical protein